MFATRRRPEELLKVKPELTHLDRRDLPSFTTPVFTNVGPVSPTQPVDWAAVANVKITSDVAETAGGTKVTVTLQHTTANATPVTVNLLTYTRDAANSTPPGDIKMQKLFAFDTAVLNKAGQTVTLTAALPACSKLYQADVALGQLSPDVKASLIFPNTNIESVFGKVDGCTTPTPTPCPNPVPPPCHNPPPPCDNGSHGKGSGGKGSNGKGSHTTCSTGSHGKGSGSKGSNGKGSGGKGSHGKGSKCMTGSHGKGSGSKGTSGKGSGGKGTSGKGSHTTCSTGSHGKGSGSKGTSGKGSHATGSQAKTGSQGKGSSGKGGGSTCTTPPKPVKC